MGVQEVVLLVLLKQLANASAVFLSSISPLPANVWAKAAVNVGKQLSANVAAGAVLGLTAAHAEFSVTNTQEKTFVTGVMAIPPIV